MGNKGEKNVVDSKAGNFEIVEDDKINLYDLWKIIIKRKMIVIAIFLISILGAAIYCFTASPIYRVESYMKLYMPKDISTVKELPTAKDISLILGKIDREKTAVIFSKNADEITRAEIGEIKGEADKFKITIESRNREDLPVALQEMITHIENIREIKSNFEKIISELNEKIVLVRKADKENDIQLKEIEKRLNNAKVLPVGFDPVAIRQNSVNLKMDKYRIEHEIKYYKILLLLEEPFISKEPVWPKKAVIIIIAGFCSLIYGISIVFVMEYFEQLRRQTQSQ